MKVQKTSHGVGFRGIARKRQKCHDIVLRSVSR